MDYNHPSRFRPLWSLLFLTDRFTTMILLFFLLLQMATPATTAHAADIARSVFAYQVKTQNCRFEKDPWISLREFKSKDQWYLWGVNERTLQTALLPKSRLQECKPLSLARESFVYKKPAGLSRYLMALRQFNQTDGHWQNQGLINDSAKRDGSYLTVDLCPSSHQFDKALFELIREKKWPTAIAVSGLWILRHETDWQWLVKNLADAPITWVNHSRNHPVYPDVPLEKNYLLSEGRDIKREILSNEILMIQRGLTPSIFFRFPGLIADDRALGITQELGLIPLGSNAWLSKGETPRRGSILLLHGNGNDPKGMTIFLNSWDQKKISLPLRPLLDLFL